MNALNRITNSDLPTLPYDLRTQMLAGTSSSNQSQLDSLVNNLLKQTFCELVMTLKSASVSDFIPLLEKHLKSGWTHALNEELKLQKGMNSSHSERRAFCFVRHGDADYLPVFLWLVTKEPHKLYVSTIFSNTKSQLSYAEYNQILEHFYVHVVQNAAAEVNSQIELKLGHVL
ncbi:MAG: hypothetical protein VSS75_034925 [Candidatus Parabeggiatoa sp.]|nr:hypothetical protein [Candidatus Parabeggiatoa sp.]